MFVTMGYIGRSRLTSSTAAALVAESLELSLNSKSSERTVPGNGALRLRLRSRCMPRVVSHEKVVPNPWGHAFSSESDVLVLYGAARSLARTLIVVGA